MKKILFFLALILFFSFLNNADAQTISFEDDYYVHFVVMGGYDSGRSNFPINTWAPVGAHFTLIRVGKVRFGGLGIGPSITFYRDDDYEYKWNQSSADFGLILTTPVTIETSIEGILFSINPGIDLGGKDVVVMSGIMLMF